MLAQSRGEASILKKLASPSWAMLEYGWYPLLLLLATPWYLHHLGTDLYGHWMLLTATVGFGGVLSAGTGAATMKAVSAAIGRGSNSEIDLTINASLALAIFGGGLLALIVFSSFWFAGSALLGMMGDPALIQLTGIAAAAVIWLEQLDNVFSSAIKGAEHFGQAARVEMASKATQVFAAALVLVWSPTLWALYAALLVVAALRLSAKVFLSRRLLGLGRLRPSFASASEILHFAKWGWLQGVGAVLFGVVDRVLVGALLGATSLAYYSIASQLAMQVHAVSAAGLSVIFPKVSRMLERGESFLLWRVAKVAMAASLLLSSSLALLLFLLGPIFLRFWIGEDSAGPTWELLPWLICAYWILGLNAVLYYLLLGMGRIRFVALTVLCSGAAAAPATYFAISNFGLIGSPAGKAVYAILSLALAFPLALHFLRERKTAFKLPLAPGSPDLERLQ